MSEWITDREPHYRDDGYYVFNAYGKVTHWAQIQRGEAWMPIVSPEPYVKPKRWRVEWNNVVALWSLRLNGEHYGYLPYAGLSNEAAHRICDIYNEVLS